MYDKILESNETVSLTEDQLIEFVEELKEKGYYPKSIKYDFQESPFQDTLTIVGNSHVWTTDNSGRS